MVQDTYPPNRFAMSEASSREKLLNSPVKTKAKPKRQLGEASGTCLEPGATGPAIFAAFAAAQLCGILSMTFDTEREGET